MNPVGPLPSAWCEAVIRILAKGQPANIRWSLRAQQDWQQFGMTFQAYELLRHTLREPGIWGEKISGMVPLPNQPPCAGSQEIHGFLCPNPTGSPKPLYAKIGLFANSITIDLFSLHIDLSGDLAKRIALARKKST